MKWMKKDYIDKHNGSAWVYTVYDDICSAVLDFMYPCVCGPDCTLCSVVNISDYEAAYKCDKRYYENHEEEVADLIGLTPYQEDNKHKDGKPIWDWTLREVADISIDECEKHHNNCNECKLFKVCGENPTSWKNKIEYEKRRKLRKEELEYLKWAYRFGYLWVSKGSDGRVILSREITTKLRDKELEAEYDFGLGVDEFMYIPAVLEDKKDG